MSNKIESIKSQIIAHKSFILYGLISVFVTLIDVIVCRISENFFSPVVSNTIGVIVGFIIQYFLTARHVYNTSSPKSFLIFFGTFLINLFLANSIVFVCRTYIFGNSESLAAFLTSKSASIVFPFFITYFIRKKLMPSNNSDS